MSDIKVIICEICYISWHFDGVVILPMLGCSLVSQSKAVPSDAFTHRIPFLFAFLPGNWYGKSITCENNGQFQVCINLLTLALIGRSAPSGEHWNQRCFGDAVFTIPLGKQWDHHDYPADCQLELMNVGTCMLHKKMVAMDKNQVIGNDLTLDQWNELWVQSFYTISNGAFVTMQKKYLFINKRGNILVTNDA